MRKSSRSSAGLRTLESSYDDDLRVGLYPVTSSAEGKRASRFNACSLLVRASLAPSPPPPPAGHPPPPLPRVRFGLALASLFGAIASCGRGRGGLLGPLRVPLASFVRLRRSLCPLRARSADPLRSSRKQVPVTAPEALREAEPFISLIRRRCRSLEPTKLLRAPKTPHRATKPLRQRV